MRYYKFIFVLILVFIFLFIIGYMLCSEDGIYYYANIQDAISDINDECIGKRCRRRSKSSVMVYFQDDIPTICLLNDVTMDSAIRLNNTNLNLNGFMLINNQTTLIRTYGVCRVYNGRLYRSCNNQNDADGLVVSRASTCYIENIVFKSESSSRSNITLRIYGTMSMVNSVIETSSLASNQKTVTVSVYGNIFSNIRIEESDVIAKSDFGRVEGVYVGDVGYLADSQIVAYANYQSNEVKFISYSIGCNNSGTLIVNNCSIYGVHSGINSSGPLSIDGGTYYGYGHGGIYCAGASQTYRIKNAIILQTTMPFEYEDMGVGCTQGGLYIGGEKNQDNITVFINNCIINASKNPIVLRGTSGEKNNTLCISNTKIRVQHIRVDNNTHRVYLGEGCNFEVSHIDIPDVVVCTGISYAEH